MRFTMKPIHYAVFFVILFMATCMACAGGYLLGNRFGFGRTDRSWQGDTVPVLVAANDLPMGTMITQPEVMLMYKPFFPDSVPSGAITNHEDVRGKVLGRTVQRNMPVTAN